MSYALVIGGTRGIGKVIVRTLAEAGYRALALGRDAKGELPDIQLAHLIFCQRYRDDGDLWQGELDVSLTLTRRAIEYYSDRFYGNSPSIVIMSSIIAHTVADEQGVAYHEAKSGLEGMARFYAVKLAPRVRVNCVAPGVVLKPENKEFYDSHPARVEMYKKHIPIGRMITAEDVANVVGWLCSPQCAQTGTIQVIDGGVSLLNQESLMRRFLKEGE